MRDNLDGLTDMINRELKEIKVSEKLKLKTLEKLDEKSSISIHKAFLPITLTMVACLFMGFIMYPIYNKNKLIHNEVATMNTGGKDIKTLKEPYMDTAIIEDKAGILKAESNKIISAEIVEGSQVNKSSKEEKQEKEKTTLNDKTIIPSKIESSMLSDKRDKDIIVATNKDIIDSEKLIKEATKDNSLVLPKENDVQVNEETKMRTLSLQEARNIFGESIKNPSYIPKDFIMEKILVPEVSNNSYELYEIIYRNNFQYFRVTEYNNINYSYGLGENISSESKVVAEKNMIININSIPVKYILRPNFDIKETPYVKLFWENGGKKYSVDGNAPWEEMINIAYYIIR
ncbi:hypothetical protein G9F72_020935 [Clostridium estertheticum]|uniref:hypothetical protein n=1 Tax=Clostridium estertheticum TaxID=238834 RepID=UPI0013E97E22|nr:hypothetical protein [Clostridium estertheticum]MBZ9688789.1 hypothetical protein [Clostridium estertheticum]